MNKKPEQQDQIAIPNLADKIFFKISNVAAMAGIEPHVLRYWESEFDELKPRKSRTGRRLYSRSNVETVMEIRSLLYDEGFSIAGAKKRLQKRKKTEKKTDAIIEAVRKTKKELKEILAILDR